MKYHKLHMDNFPQLLELEQRYKSSVGEPELDDGQIIRLKSAIQADEIEFFVATENGTICAMCSVSLMFSTFTCCQSGVFEDFFVVEEYRRKGVARELTQHVFEVLKSKGIASLWLGCADVDLKMYKSLGFTASLGNLLAWSEDE